MPKLFNKIRKKLVSEKPSLSRTRNYFKYAIGEIILVVIGILIALQINSANTNRQNNIKKIEIFTSMRHELQSIHKNLLAENKRLDGTKNKCKSLLEMIYYQKNATFKDSIHKNFWEIFAIPGNNIAFQSYQNILNTNKLELIKDHIIISQLGDINTAILAKKKALGWQDSQWNTINQPFLNKNVEMLEFRYFDSTTDIIMPQNNLLTTDVQNLFKSQEFRNIIYNRLAAAGDISINNNHLIKIINKTIISLDNKLK
ncbi:MAG: hypothetical protein COB12_01940 [Flavobacterium sp.]|nr:MAG: hypothetical protein COB12_01940 [Flavobacterium sp.]